MLEDTGVLSTDVRLASVTAYLSSESTRVTSASTPSRGVAPVVLWSLFVV